MKTEFLKNLYIETLEKLSQNGYGLNDFTSFIQSAEAATLKTNSHKQDSVFQAGKELEFAVMYEGGNISQMVEEQKLEGIIANGFLILAHDAPKVLSYDEAQEYYRSLPQHNGVSACGLKKSYMKELIKSGQMPRINAILKALGGKPIQYECWWMDDEQNDTTAWTLDINDGTDGKSKFLPEDKERKNFVRGMYKLM